MEIMGIIEGDVGTLVPPKRMCNLMSIISFPDGSPTRPTGPYVSGE